MAILLIALRLLATLGILGATTWAAGLLIFRLPGTTGTLAAVGFGVAGLAGAVGLWSGAARLPLCFAVLFLGLLGWWNGLMPSHDRAWIPELARLPSIAREGDILTVSNLRNFNWRTETDYDERWETRRYDLSKVEGIDLYLSYWSGEAIAHLLVSFPFADQPPLTFSIEVRREKGEEWSALAGFFRSYEMAYVAAPERDLVGLRSHARKEDVRLFRIAATPAQARDVLLAYVAFPQGAKPGQVDPDLLRNLALIYLPTIGGFYAVAITCLFLYRIDKTTHEENLRKLQQGALETRTTDAQIEGASPAAAGPAGDLSPVAPKA